MKRFSPVSVAEFESDGTGHGQPPSARKEDNFYEELQGHDTEVNSRFGARRNWPLPQSYLMP